MKLGIFKKQVISFTLLMILLMSVLLIISLNLIKQNYIEYTKEHLFHLAKSVEFIIKNDSLQVENKELQNKIKLLSKNIDSRVTIILKSGKVIVDSEKNPELMENHKNRPEILEASANGLGFRLRFSNTLKKKMIYVAIPLFKNGKIKAFIRLSYFTKDVNILLNGIKKSIFFTAFVLIIFSVLIFLFLANRFTKPIKELAEASTEVANGNYDVHVFTKNRDETYNLTVNFNFMIEKIRQQVSELSMKSEELTLLINSIHEIFWVIDNNEKIVFQNRAFLNFVGVNNLGIGHYWEIIKNPNLNEKIDLALKSKENLKVEIKIGTNYYLLSSSYLSKSSSTLFLLYNITQIKNLNEIKKDFVTNASHELRTPLTAIKGFLETMESELGPNYSKYFNILKRNTNRLINIVNDILLLSEIETTQKLLLEKMDIRKILKNSIGILKKNADEKKIKILTDFDDIPKINVDPFKLEQVFINLIDNAIKYSNDNSSISIKVSSQTEYVKIDFIDQGIGIKKDEIPRLFERFYVVNKSRTRKVGGTGLGLSIVKHIIQLHKGKINIQSKFEEGTKITIWLPITT